MYFICSLYKNHHCGCSFLVVAQKTFKYIVRVNAPYTMLPAGFFIKSNQCLLDVQMSQSAWLKGEGLEGSLRFLGWIPV